MSIKKFVSANKMSPATFAKNGGSSSVIVRLQCEYLGSTLVPYLKGAHRENYINDKLMGFANVAAGLNVVLVVTNRGVKTYRDDRVKLGHSMPHILLTSSLPTKHLFAYITKSYSVDHVVECHAHLYKLSKSKHYHHLVQGFEKAFKQSKRRRNVAVPGLKVRSNADLVIGHDVLDHVKRNKDKMKDLFIGETKEPLKEKVPFDLNEYIVIEDKFLVENEFYHADSLLKQCDDVGELKVMNEYYSSDCTKLEQTTSTNEWLLLKRTPKESIEKGLLKKPIGAYSVAPHQTRDDYFILHLRVPKHIHETGLLSCTIKETDKGFHLQGCLPYFQSLSELAHYYGSVHDACEGKDQVDHGVLNEMEAASVFEDYEFYESIVGVMSELMAYRESFEFC